MPSLQTSHRPARRRAWRYAVPLLLVLLSTAVAATAAAQGPQAPPCSSRPVFGWLDFWVGDWRVLVGEQQVGTNRISKVLDGCALTEEWTDTRGGTGRSLFYVSPETQLWRQVWVTNTALAIGGVKEKQLVARYPDGGVRFQGEVRVDGQVVLDRTTLTPLADGRVRQLIERSADGGATWTTGFDAVYVRAATKDSPSSAGPRREPAPFDVAQGAANERGGPPSQGSGGSAGALAEAERPRAKPLGY